jgi:hypothetical protein
VERHFLFEARTLETGEEKMARSNNVRLGMERLETREVPAALGFAPRMRIIAPALQPAIVAPTTPAAESKIAARRSASHVHQQRDRI